MQKWAKSDRWPAKTLVDFVWNDPQTLHHIDYQEIKNQQVTPTSDAEWTKMMQLHKQHECNVDYHGSDIFQWLKLIA